MTFLFEINSKYRTDVLEGHVGMTQVERGPKKLYASEDEIAACAGDRNVATLLNKFTHFFASQQRLAYEEGRGPSTAILHLARKDILAQYPIASGSLVKYMRVLHERGYILTAQYGREQVIDFAAIAKGKIEPPAAQVRTRPVGSGRKKKSSKNETFDHEKAQEAASLAKVSNFNGEDFNNETLQLLLARQAELEAKVTKLETEAAKVSSLEQKVSSLKDKVSSLEQKVSSLKLSQEAEAASQATADTKVTPLRVIKSFEESNRDDEESLVPITAGSSSSSPTQEETVLTDAARKCVDLYLRFLNPKRKKSVYPTKPDQIEVANDLAELMESDAQFLGVLQIIKDTQEGDPYYQGGFNWSLTFVRNNWEKFAAKYAAKAQKQTQQAQAQSSRPSNSEVLAAMQRANEEAKLARSVKGSVIHGAYSSYPQAFPAAHVASRVV